jgi:hypothetical protein
MFSKAIKTVDNLPNFFPETDVIFSPDERYILTGTSVKKGEADGMVMCFDRHTLKTCYQIGMGFIHRVYSCRCIKGVCGATALASTD